MSAQTTSFAARRGVARRRRDGQVEKNEKDLRRNYKILNTNLRKDRKALIKFKFKMEQEIQSIKNELSLKKTYSKGVKMEDSFEKAILADIGNLILIIHSFTKTSFLQRD